MSVQADRSLDRRDAQAMLADAIDAAAASGLSVSVAVMNPSGILQAFVRMDGAVTASVEAAVDKAYTAATFGAATLDLAELGETDAILGRGLPGRPRMVLFGGGVPVAVNGRVLGAIGVSGAPDHHDDHRLSAEVAERWRSARPRNHDPL